MKRVLCALCFGAVLASAQNQPAQRDLASVSQEMLAAIQTIQNHSSTLLKELEKKQPDRQTVEKMSAEAVTQARQIRKLIEELDAFYAQMPEAQQSALRRSWSVATILNGCMESAVDSLAGQSPDVWGEVRTSAECALRRAGQLEEVLAPFRRGR